MGKCMTDLVNKLAVNNTLEKTELAELLKYRNKETTEYLFENALRFKEKYYDKNIYIRGIVELSNNCKNNCFYCGLRRDNIFIPRYRMDEDDVLEFCSKGYERGIRTFVLVSGDDYIYTEDKITHMIETIKKRYNDCAIELSLGERNVDVYKHWFDAGADRYTLYHETADESHFKKIHPSDMSLLRRKQSLWELKETGYQVGSGFMVGAPYQMLDNVVEDLFFLKMLEPQMIRTASFVPAPHTKFEHERSGNGDMTLYILAILRLMFPRALISADTTLDNVLSDGRKKALNAGVNELFTSLTTEQVKEYYYTYSKSSRRRERDDIAILENNVKECGYTLDIGRGDCKRPPTVEKLYEKVHRIMRP